MSAHPLKDRKGANVARWMAVLWPSFLAAGLLEALVFVHFDPQHATDVLGWELSDQGVYTLSFLVMWAVCALACALSIWQSTHGAGPRTD